MAETPTVVKPGWQTTEFYTMFGANIIGILAISGVFSSVDAPEIIGQFNSLVGGVFGAIGNIMYIWSRVSVKKSQTEAETKFAIANIK